MPPLAMVEYRFLMPAPTRIGAMQRKNIPTLTAAVVCLALGGVSAAEAQCPAVPYQLSNGQTADAMQVMANLDALRGCINANGSVSSGTAGQVGYYGADGSVISGESVSNLLDSAFGSVQGSILYRGASGWSALAPGMAGEVLMTGGAAANPMWGTGVSSGLSKLAASATAVGNGNDTTEDTLHSYTLPAGTLTSPGQVIRITAAGTLAANSDTKTIRVYFGSRPTTLGTNSSGDVTWRVTRDIMTSGNNSQVISTTLWLGPNSGTTESIILASHMTTTEATTSDIVLRVTGQSGTTAANDIVCDFFLVEFEP